jgi:hypothetical protein
MVHLWDVTFDTYSTNSTKNNHFGRSTGEFYEYQAYERISKELKNHEASRG